MNGVSIVFVALSIQQLKLRQGFLPQAIVGRLVVRTRRGASALTHTDGCAFSEWHLDADGGWVAVPDFVRTVFF
jgi:hypothetical protein